MNAKGIRTLEYDKVIGLLKEHVQSEVGQEMADRLQPSGTLEGTRRLLDQTLAAEHFYRTRGRSPIGSFPDIRNLLARLPAAHSVSAEDLLRVARLLNISREARTLLQEGTEESVLSGMAASLSSHRSIEEEIGRCILSPEEIADAASPELSRIRKQIRIVNERIKEKLNSILRSNALSKYLQDPIVTVRNGRYAVPVKAEHRAQIPGLIHDQSASGATVFIEPAAVVEMGNELKRLTSEEANEIERILARLTALAAPVAGELIQSSNVLGELDVIFAKAVLGREWDGICPEINDTGEIHILKGRHPLLNADTVVPVDLWLGSGFRILVITGPNTGGKTVTLKMLGLFVLMTMSGMMIPAALGTRISVFPEVYADIGDEQSIEQSLSTFSAHMRNTVEILNGADERSLVLLDELGAGTDPVEGAALAQAILEYLYDIRAVAAATTHYSEVKAFAMVHDGIENASMEFDVDRLCPTYRLMIGIPGKSNAFEISRRLGLPETIIEHAGTFLEKKDIAFENVLSEAQSARSEADRLLTQADADSREAARIRAELDQEKRKLESEKAAIRARAREEAREQLKESKKELELLIAELRSVRDIDQKALERAVQKARDRMRQTEQKLLPDDIRKTPEGTPSETIRVRPGEAVYIVSLDKEGTILKEPDAHGEVPVQIGIVKMNVPLQDLRKKEKKQAVRRTSSVSSFTPKHESMLEVDIRGMLVEEGCMAVERFIDDCLFTGVHEFSVIHGKGTGALRTGVQNYLKHNSRVKSIRNGVYGEGDAGVTIVTLK